MSLDSLQTHEKIHTYGLPDEAGYVQNMVKSFQADSDYIDEVVRLETDNCKQTSRIGVERNVFSVRHW